MKNKVALETVDQVKALAHPTRQRILELLTEKPCTNKQLASVIGETPSRVHFHVRELLNAGLIVLTSQKPKGGVIEKYYESIAVNFYLSESLGSFGIDASKDLFGSILDTAHLELEQALDYFGVKSLESEIYQDKVTISKEAHSRIQGHLDAIKKEIDTSKLEGSTENSEGEKLSKIYTWISHSTFPKK